MKTRRTIIMILTLCVALSFTACTGKGDVGKADSSSVSEGTDKAVLIVNPYMINVHEEEHLAKLAPYYEIGERKEVKLLQGSIVYYELTRK